MAYRFKLREDLQDGVRRIAVEQLEKALAAPNGKADRVEWVHETRKALKRTRSLLRVVREGLGDERWREENAALRLIAGRLSRLRDRDVLLQTLDNFAADGGADLAEAMAWLATSLDKGRKRAAAPEKSATATVGKAIAALAKARGRLARIDIDGHLPEVLALGLARCQRTGRTALARLELDPSPENLHELRKSVQTFQRQHALAAAAWPEAQAVRVETARASAQMLGQAQDLSVLAGAVKAHRGSTRRERALAERILEASRTKQAELREAVLPTVARLMALKPKAAAEELVTCWNAALAIAAAGVDAPAARHGDSQEKRAEA